MAELVAYLVALFDALRSDAPTLFFVGLFLLNVVDFLTGTVRAWRTREISSRVGANGVIRKTVIWLLVLSAIVAEAMLAETGARLPVASGALIGFIVAEFISVLENAAALGVVSPWLDSVAKHLAESQRRVVAQDATVVVETKGKGGQDAE